LQGRLITDLRIATLADADPLSYGLIDKAAVAIRNDRIDWVGLESDIPIAYRSFSRTSYAGRLLTPGLIDCHTHVVFGGNRAAEFELRLNGASYEEVARNGGGIISTVIATRAASEEELLASALQRVDAMLAEGVTVIEIKSGYGLDAETEIRMLRVARAIQKVRSVRVLTTFLCAHSVPPEFRDRSGDYIDDVCIPALRNADAQGLVDAVDGFCEGIAFSPAQISRLFDVATQLNLPVKLHAEQLSNLGGAKLAARYGALSADHLEYLDLDGVSALAASGTVAVILPGAFYTLGEKQQPPIAALRQHGVAMAIATDCNPGSSPMTSLLLAMNMACTLFRMTPLEALRGVTVNAARALGLRDHGTIASGQRADFAIWNVDHPAELAYRIGFNPLHQRIIGGVL
jgi:imidazolonepropionase